MKTRNTIIVVLIVATILYWMQQHQPKPAVETEPRSIPTPTAVVQHEDTGSLEYREAQRQRELAARWNQPNGKMAK